MIYSLIGYRGTGKSTIGKLLAKKLEIPHCDSDDEIVFREKKSIREIFEADGEDRFRDLEAQVVETLMRLQYCVVSWGGGVVLKPRNRELISRSRFTIWLTATADCIAERIHGDGASADNRPALTNLPAIEEVRAGLREREPLYRELADLEVSSEQEPSLIVDQLVSRLPSSEEG